MDKREISARTSVLDSAAKYIHVYRELINMNEKSFQHELGMYHMAMGSLMARRRKYPEAYENIQEALVFFKKENNNKFVAYLFSEIGTMYKELALFPQAISYYDSAFAYFKLKNERIRPKSMQSEVLSNILTNRAKTFCSLYSENKEKKYEDSARVVVKLLKESTKDLRYQSVAFGILARLSFYKNDYKNCIAYIDTSLSIRPGKQQDKYHINSILYKGLCLIRLGKGAEGIKVIKANNMTDDGPEGEKILQELYKYERSRGNVNSAFYFLERYHKYQDSSAAVKYRGKIFSMQQSFMVEAKELTIVKLREKNEQDKIIAAGGLIIISLLILLGANRYRENQKKVELLINQIEELVDLQVLRIEDEKEKERKRIGQDLHDDFAGTIAAGVRYLRMKAEDEETDRKEWLVEISEMLEKGYDRVRGKSHELFLAETASGFWKQLSGNIDLFFAGTTIVVDMNFDTVGLALNAEIKTAILLTLKEAITNVIKHSKATEVSILIYEDYGNLNIEVTDNGKGFFRGTFKSSLGLRSINDRITGLGGQSKLTEKYPSGTQLKISIPINVQEEY